MGELDFGLVVLAFWRGDGTPEPLRDWRVLAHASKRTRGAHRRERRRGTSEPADRFYNGTGLSAGTANRTFTNLCVVNYPSAFTSWKSRVLAVSPRPVLLVAPKSRAVPYRWEGFWAF